GPITLLVIRRTLGAGWRIGLASGMGVATADAAYGAVAAFGIAVIADAVIADALVAVSRPLGIVGGAALVWIGLRAALRPAPPVAADAPTARGLATGYLSILGLTLTNPMTIILYGAVIVSVGVPASSGAAVSLWLGLATGSVAWWFVLVPLVALVRGRLSARVLRAVTIASGIAIAAFGVIALLGAITA
ncbi:MAG: LysE family transporter, partial [Candidatus Limnocylindrales bacterium]